MKKTDFFDLVAQPELLDEDTLPSLNDIVSEFPWFQSARMLLVKNLHAIDHMRFNGELKQSAAYIADRNRLFELVHYNKVSQPIGSVHEEEEELSDPVEIIEQEQSPQEKQSTNVEISTQVSSVSDYFTTDDVFETSDGGQIDFSVLSSKKEETDELASMVLPSADFLGYESNDFVGYELKEAINPEDKKDESHSFSEWLTVLRHAPAQAEEEEKTPKKSQQIIDNFLNIETPKIRPSLSSGVKVKSIEQSDKDEDLDDSDDLMSETLANIYIKQEYYDKAIAIYEKLSLKYPEKNVYFARRISDLEKLIN